MEITRERWLPFDHERSYTRRYNDHFYREAAGHISGRVLDLGAKTSNREQYERLGGGLEEYVSMDIAWNENLDVVGDGRQLPVKPDSVDTVVVSAVLEHVPIQEVPAFLEEIKRVLRPNGSVIAYVPFLYYLHGIPHDYYRPTYYGLDSLFTDAGFETELFVGGGAGEFLLHAAYGLYTTATGKLPVDSYTWIPFAVFHYVSRLLATGVGQVVGSSDVLDRWYIGQLIVGVNRSGE
jgi:SAM-dependent methyltransferase